MRIITWNMKGADAKSAAWDYFSSLAPDIALLQEVVEIPESIRRSYESRTHKALRRNRSPQRFGTAVLVKGAIVAELPLTSEYEWVNRALEHFSGNLVGYVTQPIGGTVFNAISVYSPAWPIARQYYEGIDVSPVKLRKNRDVYLTELLWSVLKSTDLSGAPWIIAGDLNSSETFDATFGSGNAEILERMHDLGLTECLRAHNGRLVPTFRNSRGGKVLHQMDHLFVTGELYTKVEHCATGKQETVFGQSLSDHVPIIADIQ